MSTFTRTEQRSSGGTGVVCSIGMLNFTVDLATVGRVNKAKDTSFNLVCSDGRHDTPTRMAQRYICVDSWDAARAALPSLLDDLDPDEGDTAKIAEQLLERFDDVLHHSEQDDLPGFPVGECHQARRSDPDDDKSPLVVATKDEIVAAKVGLIEPGVIDFKVHQGWEIDVLTLPGKAAYRLRPALTKKKTVRSQDMEVYAALVELLATCPHIALVGTMRVRDARATYRLSTWGGQLVLNEVLLPSDLADRDRVEATVTDEAVAQLRTLIESRMEDFDESVHRFDSKAAVAELIERNRKIAAGEMLGQVPASPAELVDDGTVIDLTSMLSQMIQDQAA